MLLDSSFLAWPLIIALLAGNQSNARLLRWFADHALHTISQPWVFSLPFWVWRILSIIWSTWLVIALLAWLKLAVEVVRSQFAAAKQEIVAAQC